MPDREEFRTTEKDRGLDVDERRVVVRFESAFDVSISKTDDATRHIAKDAWVRDVSTIGLGICCAERFEVGDIVTVHASGKNLQCEVRHCRSEGALFSMGLEVRSSPDGADIQESLRELSKALHFDKRY